jgi:membrane protein YdbS with pleckstrin-like domain
VTDLTIRPTTKFLKAAAVVTALVFLALEIAYFAEWRQKEELKLLPLVVPLVFLWPASRWVRWRSIRAIVSSDRLRYEIGLAAKSTRTIQLSKLQDVRVDQGLTQRIFDIGDISLETSGEASRLTIYNIDRPHAIADELLNRSQHGAGA